MVVGMKQIGGAGQLGVLVREASDVSSRDAVIVTAGAVLAVRVRQVLRQPRTASATSAMQSSFLRGPGRSSRRAAVAISSVQIAPLRNSS